MTEQEIAAELLRITERYKMDDARRAVSIKDAAQMGQPAGQAASLPETPQPGPELDEYAYLGKPTPPVREAEAQVPTQAGYAAPIAAMAKDYEPSIGAYVRGDQRPPTVASTGGPSPTLRPRGAWREAVAESGLNEALPYYLGPHFGGAVDKVGAAAGLATPGSGTMHDAQTAARELELGNYGRAAAATALGTAGGMLDFVPGVPALKAIMKGATSGARIINDVLPAAGAAAIPIGSRAKAAMDLAGDYQDTVGKTVREVAAPAIVRDEAAGATEKILEHAARERRPTYPPATEPVFKTGPDDIALTKELVPQTSIRGELPRPERGTNRLPAEDRARPIVENTEGIADIIARDLAPRVAENRPSGLFYGTGPVIRDMSDIAGMSYAEALEHMGRWSGQGAATSPRTATPQNLRNSSYLLWRQAQGDPLTTAEIKKIGNLPGYGMMGMHARLGEEFAGGAVNINQNPKPYVFQRNWAGNLADVTADTHNIRATLAALDELQPGKLPREWFVSDEAHKAYKKRGGFGQDPLPVGDIKDTLEGATKSKIYKQTEYGLMTDPWYRAAEKLGIDPAVAQAHGWFGYGGRTGLVSPEATIPDLLNAQIEATSRATGLHPEKILQLWSRGRIPLAEAPAGDAQSRVG